MKKPLTKGTLAVKRAFSTSDLVVLATTFIVFFLLSCGYLIYSYFADPKNDGVSAASLIIVGLIGTATAALVVFGGALVVGMFMVRMQRQMMLGNALQIEYSAYAWLRDWANQVSADLELPRVEIFITQDPVINAYSYGFIRPYNIVLQSGTIRYLTEDELRVVVVHEMGHIKYGHVNASVYLLPFFSLPVIGMAFTWLAGFWQRRAEFTADRLALMYMGNSELIKQSLIKVYVGPDAASSMNDVARQWQQYTAERPMNRFAQTFSNHPFLVRRLSQVDKWKTVVEPTPHHQVVQPTE